MANNKLMEMRKKIEILERLDKELDAILRESFYEYKCVRETVTDEQDTSWRTGELLWEDEEHTIPKMRVDREWDYVPRPEETLTEEDAATKRAVEDIHKALLNLV